MKSQINNTEYEHFLAYLKTMAESIKSFAEVSKKIVENSVNESDKPKSYLSEYQAQKRIVKIDL